MRFTHHIWDFDGTIANTYPHTAAACLEAMRRNGRDPLPPYEEVFLRLQVTWIHARDYFAMSADEYGTFCALEPAYAGKGTVFDGMREILEDVIRQGGRNYLYTLRDRTALAILEREGMLSLFTDVVTKENGFPGKPAPDAVAWLMEKHRMAPARTVMIGDRDLDGMSGVNAGCAGCLVTFLAKNCEGRDPLEVTAMPYRARGTAALRQVLGL